MNSSEPVLSKYLQCYSLHGSFTYSMLLDPSKKSCELRTQIFWYFSDKTKDYCS